MQERGKHKTSLLGKLHKDIGHVSATQSEVQGSVTSALSGNQYRLSVYPKPPEAKFCGWTAAISC